MGSKMRYERYIFILGEVHGSFNGLNSFINKRIRLDKTLKTIVPYWKRDGDDFHVIILQRDDFAYLWTMGEPVQFAGRRQNLGQSLAGVG